MPNIPGGPELSLEFGTRFQLWEFFFFFSETYFFNTMSLVVCNIKALLVRHAVFLPPTRILCT